MPVKCFLSFGKDRLIIPVVSSREYQNRVDIELPKNWGKNNLHKQIFLRLFKLIKYTKVVGNI